MDDEYAKHAENCAHLSDFAWKRFRHLPTEIAIQKGERLDNILLRINSNHFRMLFIRGC